MYKSTLSSKYYWLKVLTSDVYNIHLVTAQDKIKEHINNIASQNWTKIVIWLFTKNSLASAKQAKENKQW